MKTGYFEGDCYSLGINYNGQHYDFPIFSEKKAQLWDPVTQINITDPETEFAFFFKGRLKGKYLTIEDDFLNDTKVQKILKDNKIKFIECSEQGGEKYGYHN